MNNPDDQVQWTIGDAAKDYTRCIEELREKVANKGSRRQREYVEDPQPAEGTDIIKRPILAKPSYLEAKRCVRIELQARVDGEAWSTTLAVKDDHCWGVGFMNQSKVWYDLGYSRGWRDEILPAEYNSVLLGWGVRRYTQILQTSDGWNEVRTQLNNAAGLMSKGFVMGKAVRTLSRYPDVQDDDMNPRIAVVGLMVVFCDSAKLDHLQKSFAEMEDWGTSRVEFTEEMVEYVLAWEEISRTLMHWKRHFYREWPQNSKLVNGNGINITSKEEALKAVHLVLNRNALPDQVIYFFFPFLLIKELASFCVLMTPILINQNSAYYSCA
jgi:hypothetical protein